MIKIEDKIEKAHYVASDHDVELLAAAHLATSEATKRADGSYLRILVAALQAQFNGVRSRRKPDAEAHSAFLAETHSRLYVWILKGITTPEVADDEKLSPDDRRIRGMLRQARAGFARSAASTLQMFIRAGGDVRTLDVDTVSKTALRTWARAANPDAKPRTDFILAGLKRIERAAVALMAEDPDEARATVEECMGRLQRVLDELGPPATQPQHTITQTLRQRPVHTRQPAPAGRAHA